MDVPASDGMPADGGTVLLYGHLDKQPPVGGWSEGLGPWTPVIRGDRLYGRGAADDGYSGYAASAAIEAVRAAGGRHARCLVLLETSEESGSPDLEAYLEAYRARLGDISLVVCLDSGGQDYERLWLTTSLRGLVSTTVTVTVLESGQHSGIGERHRAQLVPDHAPAAGPHRGLPHRRDPAAGAARRHPGGPRRAR